MKSATIIFPHQLFADFSAIQNQTIYLVETDLFFNQYSFHKQKIAYHRATMKAYADLIHDQVNGLNYINAQSTRAKVPCLVEYLAKQGVGMINIYPVHDDWLSGQLVKSCDQHNIEIHFMNSFLFLNTADSLSDFFSNKESYFHHHFYQQQRRKHQLLMHQDKPVGGQWSFDDENRKKYPKTKQPPSLKQADWTEYHQQAFEYTEQHFGDNYGQAMQPENILVYPINHSQAEAWLHDFVYHRLDEFGPYEDAICASQSVLNHSVLTPMLNIGLLTPWQIIVCVMDHAAEHDIPLNSLEGFIRQIIGWREYMHGLYHYTGRRQRCHNFWNHHRPMPKSFYTGETGIEPFDQTIKKVLATGYCHHIERLMVLGNFMFLCEIHPDAVYQWFMELFIDAYDWVMVPNIYGMSQFADGGMMATKPYISGSNYIKKMSDYPKGDWCDTWDGLYWRFIDKHIDYFQNNNRTAMMAHNWCRQKDHKKESHLKTAEKFLSAL
jgi:deoxyribodipyrimidine photolyase-related protein